MHCPQTKHGLLRCTSSQVQVLHLFSEQCSACKKDAKGASERSCYTFFANISGDNRETWGFWMMEISELLSSYCLSKELRDQMLGHPFSIFFFHSVRCFKPIKDWKVLRFHLFIHSFPPRHPVPHVYQKEEKWCRIWYWSCFKPCPSSPD